jgi:D-tyrosyl-tRNA(Tyr) deacylase
VTTFVEALRGRGATVQTGRFRAHMLVESVNVGPRTVLIEL